MPSSRPHRRGAGVRSAAAAIDRVAAINALIAAAKRTWRYDPGYLAAAMPLLRIDAAYLASHPWFEARRSGVLVGFAALEAQPDAMLVDHLWVAPHAQRTGIGAGLFGECVARARADNARVLRILSDPPAEGFYLRMGALRVATKPSRIAGGPVFPVLELSLADSSV
jgi:GNAT superfamily N-acetyltransferase